MELYNYLGHNKYSTSAFCIVLDLPIDLTNFKNGLNDHQFALYLHEYIHFLQDFSTIYGLMKFSNILLYTKAQASYAVKKRYKKIKIPAHAPSDSHSYSYVKRNYDMFQLYRGDGVNSLSQHFDKHSITIKQIKEVSNLKPSNNETIKTLQITIEDQNGTTNTVCFGGEIICENMASLAEREYLKNKQLLPSKTTEYPYYLAEKLAEFIYPEIASLSKEWLFWIMDLCLSKSFNPGYVFFLLIKDLKDNSFVKAPTNEKLLAIFDKIINGGKYTLMEIHKEILDELDQIFRLPMFDGNKDWLKVEFERIRFLRQDSQIMRSFMQYKKTELSRMARVIMDMLGHPTVKNDISEAIIQPPARALKFHQVTNLCLWYFEAYKEVFSALNIPHYKCQMYKDCVRSKIIDKEILNTKVCPEQQKIYNTTSSMALCPFGVFWKSLGLWGKKPI